MPHTVRQPTLTGPPPTPAIDIVITTCQRLALLRQTLRSVCAQTFTDYRVFLVNDAPADSDAVQAIIDDLADARVQLVSPSRKVGANRARNLGIAAGSAPLVAFIDDDDLWQPHKLARHIEAHRDEPAAGMVYSDFMVQLDRPIRLRFGMGGEALADAPVAAIATSRVSVRRDALESVQAFDPDLVAYQDFDIWYRIMQRWPATRLPDVLNIIRIHDGERITRLAPVERGGEQILKKYHADPAIHRLQHMIDERNFFLAIREARQRSRLAGLRYAISQKSSRSMRIGGCILALGGEPAYQCGRAVFRRLAGNGREPVSGLARQTPPNSPAVLGGVRLPEDGEPTIGR